MNQPNNQFLRRVVALPVGDCADTSSTFVGIRSMSPLNQPNNSSVTCHRMNIATPNAPAPTTYAAPVAASFTILTSAIGLTTFCLSHSPSSTLWVMTWSGALFGI